MKNALLVRFQAKKGKEADVEAFLEKGLELAHREQQTPVWYALKLNEREYGVFDSFRSEEGRQAHLEGDIAKALMASIPTLLEGPPTIERVDVLGAKISA